MIRAFARSMAGLQLAVAVWASTARAQEPPTGLPGYVAFDAKSLFDGAPPKVEVNLPKALLRVAAAAIQRDQPEFSEVLDALEVIRVQVYERDDAPATAETAPPLAPDLPKLDSALAGLRQDPNWMQTVKVQEGKAEESVNGFVNVGDNGNVQGLAVFVNDLPETLVFVNIVGDIEPELLGKVLAFAMQGQVDLSGLGDLVGQGIPGLTPPPPPPPPPAPAAVEAPVKAEPIAAP